MGFLFSLLLINIGAVLFKNKTNSDSGLSFFTVFCLGTVFIFFGGLAGFLKLAALIYYSAIILLAVIFTVKNKIRGFIESVKSYIDLSVVLNNFFSAVMIAIYAIQKPYFYYWDEYSFWGTSAKVVKCFDKLYSDMPYAVNGFNALPCGNSILNYFLSFFAKDFCDWHLYASYTILYIASFSLIAALVKKKTDSTPLQIITFITLFLSPFMSVFHRASANYSSLFYAYGTGMVDFNIPVVLAAAVAVYLFKPDKKWYLLPLMFLTTVKNTSIFFSLLAAAIICCFAIFDRSEGKFVFSKDAKTFLITLLAPVIVYSAWTVHVKTVAPVVTDSGYTLKESTYVRATGNDADSEKERDENCEPQILSVFVPSLRTQRHSEVLESIKNMFLTESITILGKDRFLVLGLILMGAVTVVFADKKSKFAVGIVNSGLAAGCLVYALTISYFISFFADGMVEYPRYMTSYYFSWIFVSSLLFAIHCKKEWLVCAVYTFVLCVSTKYIYTAKLSKTVISAPDNAYSLQMHIEEDMEKIKTTVKKGDRVYLIFKDRDSQTYLYYNLRFLPAFIGNTKNTDIDFSVNFREKIDPDSDKTYYNVASPMTFRKVISEYFDYVYVVEPDDETVKTYGGLFSDGMTVGTLYKITDGEVPMQEVVFDE